MNEPKCPRCGDDDGVLLCGDCMFAQIDAEAAGLPILSPHLMKLLRNLRTFVPTADDRAEQKTVFVRDLVVRCRHGSGEFEQCAACRDEARDQQEALSDTGAP